MLDRARELAAIDSWIADHGLTRIDPKFAGKVIGALFPDEERRRLAALELSEPANMKRQQHIMFFTKKRT